MAAGSRSLYKLDLEDIIAFPDTAHVPLLPPTEGESWIILAEIIRNDSVIRPVFQVKDKIGCCYPVAFYTDNPAQDAKDCKIGHVICIKNGMRHHFADGSNGHRIEDPTTVFVLPCSLDHLRAFNKKLREKSDRGEIVACNVCLAPSLLRCAKCKTRYCTSECQRLDWKEGHRKECPILAQLHIWNRTDWG